MFCWSVVPYQQAEKGCYDNEKISFFLCLEKAVQEKQCSLRLHWCSKSSLQCWNLPCSASWLLQQSTCRSLQRENVPSTLLKESSLQQTTAYREKVGLLFMAHFHKKYLPSYSCPAPTAKQQPSSIKKCKEIFAKPTLP